VAAAIFSLADGPRLSGVSSVPDQKCEADWIFRRMKSEEGRLSALSDYENPVAFARVYQSF